MPNIFIPSTGYLSPNFGRVQSRCLAGEPIFLEYLVIYWVVLFGPIAELYPQ